MWNLSELKPGDRLTALYDDGWHGSIICVEIVRVNRVTITVRDEQGNIARVEPWKFDRKMTEHEKQQSYEWFPRVPARGNLYSPNRGG